MLTRRHLFGASAAALLTGAALAGCANFQAVAATVSADAVTIANGLTGVLAQLGTVSGIPAATLTKIGTYIADLQSVASSLQSATQATAPSLVQAIETDVNSVVSTVAGLGLPLPPVVQTALEAATILLPVLETAVGLVVNSVTGTTSTTTTSAAAPMTPDQARAALLAIAVTVHR